MSRRRHLCKHLRIYVLCVASELQHDPRAWQQRVRRQVGFRSGALTVPPNCLTPGELRVAGLRAGASCLRPEPQLLSLKNVSGHKVGGRQRAESLKSIWHAAAVESSSP